MPFFVIQGLVGFCLAIQPTDEDMGTIGRKYGPCIRCSCSFSFYYSSTKYHYLHHPSPSLITNINRKIIVAENLSYSNAFLFTENFMTGYRMVFDRENHKLGWTRSSCEYISSHNVKAFCCTRHFYVVFYVSHQFLDCCIILVFVHTW